jgi:hypothetical protein
MIMDIILDNNFSGDSLGRRAVRLQAMQANFAGLQPILNMPAVYTTWAADCHDVFMDLWTSSDAERGEKEGAYAELRTEIEDLTTLYADIRLVIIARYQDDPDNLKDYELDRAFPNARKGKVERVRNIVKISKKHEAEGDPNALPQSMIDSLNNACDAVEAGYDTALLEKVDAREATDNLWNRFDSDTEKLREIYSWTRVIIGRYDLRFELLGMVPSKKRTGGQPGVPQNLAYDMGSGQFSWDAVDTATSYQLAYRAIGSNDWEEAYKGADTSVTFDPGNGEWEFRVRARNEHGYGDWSVLIAVSIGLQPPQIWELVYNPSTNKVTLQWHASIGADYHDVYQSVVPLGQGAGDFTMIESVAGQVYQHDVSTYDVREYYYVIARNASGSSDPSEIVFVDVAAS